MLMSIVAGQVPIIAGTLPQWIAALFSAGIFGAILKFGLGWRGQTLDSDEKIRDHYAKEVARLTDQLNQKSLAWTEQIQGLEAHYRKMLEESDRRHEECQIDREALRKELNDMHAELTGLKRQIARYSTDKLLVMDDESGGPSATAPSSVAAARRSKRLRDEGDL